MAEKELWPGAGLWLDVANIMAADFAAVERRLEEIGDTLAQISFLKRLEIEFTDLERRHHANLRRTENVKEETEEVKNPVIPVIMDFMRRSVGFQTELFIKLDKLNDIREIEREEERERSEMPALAPSPADSEAIDDDPAEGQWTNEQKAVALYALLRAAGLPDKHNKTAVASFAHVLTGRSAKRMSVAHLGAVDGGFNDQTAQVVADELEKMGLAKVAADVRNRFGKSG